VQAGDSVGRKASAAAPSTIGSRVFISMIN
jgi:hypothetical protein